jgi:hypothetical protein
MAHDNPLFFFDKKVYKIGALMVDVKIAYLGLANI